MVHPVKELNQLSQTIVEGDYDAAIVSLAKTLRNIKLVLSGDAKITMPKAPEHNEDEASSDCDRMDDDCDDHKDSNSNSNSNSNTTDTDTTDSVPSTTWSGVFEYDFYNSPPDSVSTTSSFLNTSVVVQEQQINRLGHNKNIIQERTVSVSIFKHPLIVKGDCFEVPLDARLCEELSCVAMYNLALCHQLKAISMANSQHRDLASSRGYLFKALSLYEYSHQIFRNNEIHVKVPALHYMALVSNLGQIHHLMGDFSKHQQCNEYLLSVLMYAIDGGKVETDSQQQVVEGFISIVQHLIISEDCTAEAA